MNTNALTLDSQSSTLGRSPWLSRSRRRPFVLAPQLERTLEGHTDWVWSVAVTPDGRRAVSAGADARVRVWDLEKGQLERTLEGHTDWVLSVAVTPDGRRAVSAGDDARVRVWDLEKGQLERTLEGHQGRVWSVAVTPDGRRAVSAGADARARVWDLETGQLAGIQTTSSALQACATNGRSIVLGGEDGSVDFLAFENFPETNLRWWITPRRLWRVGPFTTLNPAQAPAASPFSPQRGEGPGMRGGAAQDPPFHDEGERRARQRKRATPNAGHRDDEWIARCPRCGKEFAVPQPVIDAITSFATTPPPDAAEDPRLFFDCPDCHGPLRSTPFVCGTP